MTVDPQTLAWLRTVLGPDACPRRPLLGGITSRVHLVEAGDRRAVLKQVTNPTWLAERPDVVEYEARVLRFLAKTPVPVPEVLAVDRDGETAGTPSMLLSWIDATPAGDLGEPDKWLDQLVEVAGQIAALEPPGWIRPFTRYLEANRARPPVWAVDAGVWRYAIDAVRGQAPRSISGLIHRDYHPWNVLWKGKVEGVVDWSQTSVGPIQMDIAHCRANLAIGFGAEVADVFRSKWRSATGDTHDPYWDLVTCVDFLPDWRPSAHGNSRLEAWVRHLLAEQ